MGQETVWHGLGISDGIAIGYLYLFPGTSMAGMQARTIAKHEIAHEIWRYERARHASRGDLERLQIFLAKDTPDPAALSVIDSHIQMLADPTMAQMVEHAIRERQLSCEGAFYHVIEKIECQIGDSAPLMDVKDISHRILKYLVTEQHSDGIAPRIPPSTIAVGYEFVPTYAAEEPNIRAFISELGASTSHIALIARARHIPYVSGISFADLKPYHMTHAIVDGTSGKLILNPTASTLADYLRKQQQLQEKQSVSRSFVHRAQPRSVELLANIESVEDSLELQRLGFSGVGLCRTEFLFKQNDLRALPEEKQIAAYEAIAQNTPSGSLVMRLFDLGSDKPFSWLDLKEQNPALGLRSMRYLFKEERLLSTQIRALLLASRIRKIDVLIPLVTDVDEILQTKEFFWLMISKLHAEGHTSIVMPRIGVMVEAPAAAVMIPTLMKHCDFASIGTNDLIQYTMVADRLSPLMARYYNSIHPAIVRLLHQIIQGCRSAGKPLSLCGEMGANPLFIPLLVGLGLRSISCGIRYLGRTDELLESLDLAECEALAKEVLQMESSSQIQEALSQFFIHRSRRALV